MPPIPSETTPPLPLPRNRDSRKWVPAPSPDGYYRPHTLGDIPVGSDPYTLAGTLVNHCPLTSQYHPGDVLQYSLTAAWDHATLEGSIDCTPQYGLDLLVSHGDSRHPRSTKEGHPTEGNSPREQDAGS